MRPFRHRTFLTGAPFALAVALLGATAAASPAAAQDADAAQDAAEADIDDATKALLAEYDAAFEAYLDARDEAIAAYLAERETNENASYSPPDQPDAAFFGRFADLADRGSLAAQRWCVTHYAPGDDIQEQGADFARRALDCLAQPAGDQGMLVSAIARRAPSRYAPRNVLDIDTAAALLHLAEIVLDDPEARAMAGYQCGSTLVQRESSKARGLDVLRRVAEDYADLDQGRRAGSYVFELENLQIGMVAPEIEGADVDGNPMKLTDFRGKVVVLDFWGFW